MPPIRSGLPSASRRRTPGADERHLFERVAAVAPVEERRVADVARRAVGSTIANHHQALGRCVRQRPQQDGVDDAEDRGVCADAERECHQRDRGKARSPPQQTGRIAHVAAEVDENTRSSDGRRRRRRSRAIRACNFSGDMSGIVEGRERPADRVGFWHARSDELRVVLGDVLCQLVDDIGFARRIDRQRREPGANQRLPVLHGTSYSPRITVKGSTEEARRAGTYAAAAPAARTTTDAVAMRARVERPHLEEQAGQQPAGHE